MPDVSRCLAPQEPPPARLADQLVIGDLVIGDDDGVVVLPPGPAPEILAAACEQERQEEFAAARVASGAELDGLYPLGERWREAYETCVKEHEP